MTIGKTQISDTGKIVCILLAAGKGARFDSTGLCNKLLQAIPDGQIVAVAAATTLLKTLPVLAVVRPNIHDVAACLRAVGCEITECDDADQGMGASLVAGVSKTRDAQGWLVALADMPYLRSSTVVALVDAVQKGASIAVPTSGGLRGNPVAFSYIHLPDLLQLGGDEGARSLFKKYQVTEIAVDDPGIFHDIDTFDDFTCMVKHEESRN